MSEETPLQLAMRIARDPDAASDSDKLRSVADYLDVLDALAGITGTEAQDFLRDLATRLEES